MNNYKSLLVFMEGRRVGTLAKTADHLVAFEYDPEWLATGFSISPRSLPLQEMSRKLFSDIWDGI